MICDSCPKAQENERIIEEFEKLKAEFEEDRYILLNQTVAIQIIDKHIDELKENNKQTDVAVDPYDMKYIRIEKGELNEKHE